MEEKYSIKPYSITEYTDTFKPNQFTEILKKIDIFEGGSMKDAMISKYDFSNLDTLYNVFLNNNDILYSFLKTNIVSRNINIKTNIFIDIIFNKKQSIIYFAIAIGGMANIFGFSAFNKKNSETKIKFNIMM